MRILALAAVLLAPAPLALRSSPQDPAAKTPAAATPAPKPADVASVDAIVAALYDVISGPAGKARDWDRMRSLFLPQSHLVPVIGDGDATRAIHMTVEDYVRRSGPVIEKNGFYENEIARRIETFGNIAHVFSTYASRKTADDAEPFARGINSIQLVRQRGRWWIAQITWQEESAALPIPAEYLPAKPAAK